MDILLFITIISAAIFLILWLGNRKKGERQHQYWSPVAALVLTAWVTYAFYRMAHQNFSVLSRIIDEIAPLQAFIEKHQSFAEIIVSLILILLFAINKLATNEFRGAVHQRKVKKNKPIKLSRWSLAYKKDAQANVVLRRQLVFPAMYFKYFSILVSILFLGTLIWQTIEYLSGQDLLDFPLLSAFAVLISLEIYWYLQHPKVEEALLQEQKPVRSSPSNSVNYLSLWDEYQQIWREQLLLAWHYQTQTEKQPTPTTINVVEANNLLNVGYELTIGDYHILEELSNRHDLIIDDLITNETAPLLFTTFLRRLMDGENILVLTARRCYTDSTYHQAIVTWIEDWFYQLTRNKEFWKVQLFSKVEDVTLSSRIIVSSADDILEKNILNHQWFEQLKTILFLEGEAIFAESLTANNILLDILRHNNKHIQSVVLSDYRESLQSSVMRNLNVQRNLKELRRIRTIPSNAFVLFWKLEGNQLFQHKVLSGHIEKDLGAEAVLSLLARREQLKPIQMVGQAKLPYYEYLEELDNNSSSLLETPVPRRSLQKKAVRAIQTSEAPFLLPQHEDNFILARDDDFNAVAALKKWQSHATKNVFVHIVSPPYLLRDYFMDHIQYFVKTPIYPLSAKMMISRFEVARTLLERMTHQELSEQEILEDLSWINPNVYSVKAELHKLFKLAFGIDIIVANYLSIRTVHEFDKSVDAFHSITKYSLLPRIKENINLGFLRKVHIVDQAKNTLQVLDRDFVFQNYLPDQIHAFNGNPYNIRGFDHITSRLRTNHSSPKQIISYRSDLAVTIHSVAEPLTESHQKKPNDLFRLELCEGTFEVKTRGYFTFRNNISFAPSQFTYTPTNTSQVPTRHYPLGRMIMLTMQPSHLGIDCPKVSATLCALLHEMMPTLFPETYQYIRIGSPVNELVFNDEFNKLFPTVVLDDVEPSLKTKVIWLAFLEDAHQDVGLVQSIFDKWEYILRIADDYLHWLLTEKSNGAMDIKGQVLRKTELDNTSFLRYGLEELPEFFDLEGTAKLLRALLGGNYMTSERTNFYG